MKIIDDKYYTPLSLAKRLIDKAFEVIGIDNISEVVEPSAGNGSFSSQIDGCIAYDIEPEATGIIKDDFLTTPMIYRPGRLFIGNPPFGPRNSLSVKFFKRAIRLGDYIAFVQPISQYSNNLQMWEFDLVYSEDLGVVKYSDRDLHCCFNIYKRPSGGVNPKPDYTLKDITIVEHRRNKGDTGPNKYIDPSYDYAITNFGSGCFGKSPEYVGQYANELYFYCHKKEYLPKMLELLEYNRLRDYVKSISMKKMSKMRFYKMFRDEIEGIE